MRSSIAEMAGVAVRGLNRHPAQYARYNARRDPESEVLTFSTTGSVSQSNDTWLIHEEPLDGRDVEFGQPSHFLWRVHDLIYLEFSFWSVCHLAYECKSGNGEFRPGKKRKRPWKKWKPRDPTPEEILTSLPAARASLEMRSSPEPPPLVIRIVWGNPKETIWGDSEFMNIRPLSDRVVVRRLEEDSSKIGSLYVPECAKEKPVKGEVVAAGPGKYGPAGERIPLAVKEGDHVLIGKYSGSDVKVGDREFTMVREDEILGLVEKGPQLVHKNEAAAKLGAPMRSVPAGPSFTT